MRNWSKFSFFVVAVLWGSSFAFQKTLFTFITPYELTFWNFAIGGVAICCIAAAKKVTFTYRLKEGVILGVLLAGVEISQMLGLRFSTSADTAFISNIGMLLIPYAGLLLFRHRVRVKDNIAIVIAIIGMYLLVGGVHGFGFGEAMLLVSAVVMSLYFLYSQRFEGEKSSHVLTLLVQQFFITTILSGIAVLVSGGSFLLQGPVVPDLLWMAVVFTVVPYVLIQWASRWADEMIATLYDGVVEPLVGGITSWVFFSEPATRMNVVGGLLMVVAFAIGGIFSNRHFLRRGLKIFDSFVR